MERKLDWRKSPPDPRDERFLVRSLLDAPTPFVSKEWAGPYVRLDQGREGACVGFGITNDLMGSPVRVRPPGYDKSRDKASVGNAFAQRLYEQARRVDEWPGEDYSGTSVRAGLMSARAAGYIAEFRWLRTAADLRSTIPLIGPVIVGVNWTEAMFDTDRDGTIRRGGQVVGGHCLCINGIYTSRHGRPQYRTRQSWGRSYGIDGDAWFDAGHLEDLLFGQGGEAAVSIPASRT